MGGIISTKDRFEVSESSKSSKSFIITKGLPDSFASCPLLPFEDIQILLPLCVESWNHVVKTKVESGSLLGDLFQIAVFNELRGLNSDLGTSIEKFLSNSRQKRTTNPVTSVMRYCIRARRSSDSQFKKRLVVLGREHSRIGVTQEMITKFTEVLLNAFGSCLTSIENREAIMFAWAANMKYIVTNMTVTSFSFMRVISGKQLCAMCGSMDTLFEGLCDGCAKKHESMSFSYDGLDHTCHPIPEVSGKDISILYKPERGSFRDPGIRREWSNGTDCDTDPC